MLAISPEFAKKHKERLHEPETMGAGLFRADMTSGRLHLHGKCFPGGFEHVDIVHLAQQNG